MVTDYRLFCSRIFYSIKVFNEFRDLYNERENQVYKNEQTTSNFVLSDINIINEMLQRTNLCCVSHDISDYLPNFLNFSNAIIFCLSFATGEL